MGFAPHVAARHPSSRDRRAPTVAQRRILIDGSSPPRVPYDCPGIRP